MTMREWGVLLKAHVDSAGEPPTEQQLESLRDALEGTDKKLTGKGRDFTLWWWVEAPDAASAAAAAAVRLREAAATEGIPELRFIRSHAASIEGRHPVFRTVADRATDPRAWALDYKVVLSGGPGSVTDELLARVGAAVGGSDLSVTLRGDPEKFLLDDGSGFTVRFWADGKDIPLMLREGRQVVVSALEATGIEGWQIVRLKARTAADTLADTFPGAELRAPQDTEETR